MPVSIPLILETTQLAIDSCDTMNLDTGDISNTGKSTAAQTNFDSELAQIDAIEASSETFKTLGDLTQLIIPVRNEFIYIVSRINSKLRPYEEAVARADREFAQISNSESWYATNIPLKEAERDAAIVVRDDAQAALDALDSESPTYAADAAVQNNIIGGAVSDIVSAQSNLDNYANEVVDLAENKVEWQGWQDYHQAVIDDIISTFNTIMAPVRSAFSAAKSAIQTSNSNISSGKDQMLDGAAAIAKTLAKTASAAVTQAIGDIAENSKIMAPINEPVSNGGPSDVSGWPSFRGAKDTQQFLGPIWDGVTVPSHVELRSTQYKTTFGMGFGEKLPHIFQPRYTSTEGIGMMWLPMPIDGKIHSYPIELNNNFILGNERLDQGFDSPAGIKGEPGRTTSTVHWYSWSPGGEPLKDVNGMSVVFSVVEGPNRYIHQLYSLKDRDWSLLSGAEEKGNFWIDPTKSEYNRGKIVIPIVNQTLFYNLVTVPKALGNEIITCGPGRTNVNGRAPTAQEVTVIDVDEFDGERQTFDRPSGFVIRRSNSSRNGSRTGIKSYNEYIEQNKITLEPPPPPPPPDDDDDKYKEDEFFKNKRQLRGARNTGYLKNQITDSLGPFELIEEPKNLPSRYEPFGNKRFSFLRVGYEEIKQFFGIDLGWDRSDTHYFFDGLYAGYDDKVKGDARFAPAHRINYRTGGDATEYKLKRIDNGQPIVPQPVRQGDFIRGDTVEPSQYTNFKQPDDYLRLLIYHEEDQGFPNTHGEVAVDELFGPLNIYTPRNFFFGYVAATDVEKIEYLPWKTAKEAGPWSSWEINNPADRPTPVPDTDTNPGVFVTYYSDNLSLPDDYEAKTGYTHMRVEYIEYVMFGGQPAYRMWFYHPGDRQAFVGRFDRTTDLVIAQRKTPGDQADDDEDETDEGTLGEEPFIATDGVLTYDTSERATFDFKEGLYPNERLIRINNFRRSEDLGLGELFIVKSPDWIPVNEWEENWRKETGGPVDVEEYYNVINNVIGVRKPPLNIEEELPPTPEFKEPTKSKTIRLGDRTVILGPMNPTTDLISGADSYERATKAFFEDITPFVTTVENNQQVATQAVAGLGGFDEEKVNEKEIADIVAGEVKKLVTTAENAKDDAKFDFAEVTKNLTSVAATNIAVSVKSSAKSGTSLMTTARSSAITTSSTAFPQNEQLIARPEPPVLPEPFDITSGGRIPS